MKPIRMRLQLRLSFAFLALALVVPLDLLGQPEIADPPVRYDADYPSAAFHQDRRARVLAALPEDAVAVFFSAPERRRSGGTHYAYRQDNDLLSLIHI